MGIGARETMIEIIKRTAPKVLHSRERAATFHSERLLQAEAFEERGVISVGKIDLVRQSGISATTPDLNAAVRAAIGPDNNNYIQCNI
jgi:hypothetical protein